MVNNKTIVKMEDINKEIKWLNDHIRCELVEAESDIDIMEYTLEEIYDERLQQDCDYYKGKPNDLRWLKYESIVELDIMEREYIESEEYEKCQAIVRVKQSLIKKYNIVKPNTVNVV